MYDHYYSLDLNLTNLNDSREMYLSEMPNNPEEALDDCVEGAVAKAIILGCFDAAQNYKGRTREALHIMPHISRRLEEASADASNETSLVGYLIGGEELPEVQYSGGLVGTILNNPKLAQFDQKTMAVFGEELLDRFEETSWPSDCGNYNYIQLKQTPLGQMSADYRWLAKFINKI